MAELCKYDELRMKTEKELIQLINHDLDVGIRQARQALKTSDTWAVAEHGYLRAEKAYAEASLLIPLVAEITEEDRRKVRVRLEHLHELLEALSAIGTTPTPAEDEIAVLARALWEARGCPEGLPEEDWFRAERALKTQRESNAVCFVS